jgi:hypothetical protein
MAGGRLWHWFAGIGVLAAAGLLLYPVGVYTDHAFVDENTGSRYGYRTGPGGSKMHSWYQASPLEEFVQREDPSRLQHRWRRVASTGKNFLGKNVSFGCGKTPGSYYLKEHVINLWIDRHGEKEVLALYDSLRTSTLASGQAIVEKVGKEVELY